MNRPVNLVEDEAMPSRTPTTVVLTSLAVTCVDGLIAGAPGLRAARKATPALAPSCSFATTVAPFVGAGLANGMFFSGLPEVLQKRKEGKLGDFKYVESFECATCALELSLA